MNEEELQQLQAAANVLQKIVDNCPPDATDPRSDGEQWRERFAAWQILLTAARNSTQPKSPMMLEPQPSSNGTEPELVEADG